MNFFNVGMRQPCTAKKDKAKVIPKKAGPQALSLQPD